MRKKKDWREISVKSVEAFEKFKTWFLRMFIVLFLGTCASIVTGMLSGQAITPTFVVTFVLAGICLIISVVYFIQYVVYRNRPN